MAHISHTKRFATLVSITLHASYKCLLLLINIFLSTLYTPISVSVEGGCMEAHQARDSNPQQDVSAATSAERMGLVSLEGLGEHS